MFTVVMKTVSIITLLVTMIIGTGNERSIETTEIPDIRSDIRVSPIDGKDIPTEMNYQGYLILSADSTPVNENLNMVFNLFLSETGGSSFWSETHNNVQVENGIFNVILGSTTALDPDDFTGSPLWLQTTVGGEILTPRKKIVSTAYSVRALYSDTALYTLNIDSVIYADTSGYSFLALFSDTSNYSFYALLSDSADYTIWADSALYSKKADSADYAIWADSALYSKKADTADYALNGNPDNDWTITGNVLYPFAQYGLAMYGNTLHGSNSNTHVNLGVGCITGASGHNYSYCTVGGGLGNTSSGYYTTVVGGSNNICSGWYAIVGGGNLNTSSGQCAIVGGGNHNTSSSAWSTVGGGRYNRSSDTAATVAGGYLNISSNYASTIGGGYHNNNSGYNATIPGGRNVNVSGDYSFGFGRGASTTSFNVVDNYDVVFGDGNGYDYQFGINLGNPSYPLHIGNNSSNGNGAYLTGSGVWTNGCSRTFKENFTKPDPYKILELVKKLDVFRYNYKGDVGVYHISPVAEDFYDLFKTGNDNRYLAGLDVSGVALLAIKALVKENEEITLRVENNSVGIIQLRRENQELNRNFTNLTQENQELRSDNQEMRNEIEQMRADIEMLKRLNN